MPPKQFDLITMGRVSMDLFSQNIGVPFEQIEGFDTSVGGSPSNIAIGSSRLGLRVALLTAVGQDEVGKFVLHALNQEQVDTSFIPTIPTAQTGLAVVGVQPPSNFPLVFYRDNPADIHLTVDDVMALPLAQSETLLISGTALSRGSCREATMFAAIEAQAQGVTTFIDLDLRPDQWAHPRAYGLNMRAVLPHLEVVIGTEEEVFAALATDPAQVMQGQAVTTAQQEQLERLVTDTLGQSSGPQTFVVKRGARGVTIYTRSGEVIQAEGFPVAVLNTVGAGDAFASGLIYGYRKGWDWHTCARMGNACGAMVVTRHGCSKALPYEQEALDFITERGGF